MPTGIWCCPRRGQCRALRRLPNMSGRRPDVRGRIEQYRRACEAADALVVTEATRKALADSHYLMVARAADQGCVSIELFVQSLSTKFAKRRGIVSLCVRQRIQYTGSACSIDLSLMCGSVCSIDLSLMCGSVSSIHLSLMCGSVSSIHLSLMGECRVTGAGWCCHATGP